MITQSTLCSETLSSQTGCVCINPAHRLPLWESRCLTRHLTHWSVLRLLPRVQSSSSPDLLRHKGTHRQLNACMATIVCWFNIHWRLTEECGFLSCAVPFLTVIHPLKLHVHATLGWANRQSLIFGLYRAAASRSSQISAHTNIKFMLTCRAGD